MSGKISVILSIKEASRTLYHLKAQRRKVPGTRRRARGAVFGKTMEQVIKQLVIEHFKTTT